MSASTCKGCGATLRWIKTAAGKAMPCDPGRVVEFLSDLPVPGPRLTLVTPEGQVVTGPRATAITPGARSVEGYVSHFATCPHANQFRKGA